jgi:hypothetical protein
MIAIRSPRRSASSCSKEMEEEEKSYNDKRRKK